MLYMQAMYSNIMGYNNIIFIKSAAKKYFGGVNFVSDSR